MLLNKADGLIVRFITIEAIDENLSGFQTWRAMFVREEEGDYPVAYLGFTVEGQLQIMKVSFLDDSDSDSEDEPVAIDYHYEYDYDQVNDRAWAAHGMTLDEGPKGDERYFLLWGSETVQPSPSTRAAFMRMGRNSG